MIVPRTVYWAISRQVQYANRSGFGHVRVSAFSDDFYFALNLTYAILLDYLPTSSYRGSSPARLSLQAIIRRRHPILTTTSLARLIYHCSEDWFGSGLLLHTRSAIYNRCFWSPPSQHNLRAWASPQPAGVPKVAYYITTTHGQITPRRRRANL